MYAYTCPCARVNTVSGPFFREGGQILSLRVYNMPTVSTISRPRLLVVHSVYRLYPGKCECAQCLQTMQSVCRLYAYAYMYTLIRRVYVAYTYTRIHDYAYTRVYVHVCVWVSSSGPLKGPCLTTGS